MDAYTFMVQQRTFDVHGYALNPSTASASSMVGSAANAQNNGFAPVDAMRPSKSTKREHKRKRAGKGDAGVVDGDDAYLGPWAAYESEKATEVVEEDPEAEEEWRQEKKRRDDAKEAALAKAKEAKVEKSIFHGMSTLQIAATDHQLTPHQARSSRIMLGGRTCTSRPMWTSSSIPPMGPRLQTHIYRSVVYIHGFVILRCFHTQQPTLPDTIMTDRIDWSQ